MRKEKGHSVYFALGILAIFMVWIVLSHVMSNAIVLPKIEDVGSSLGKLLLLKTTYKIIFKTMLRLILTMIISFFLALFLAVLSLFSSKFALFIKPFMITIKTVPIAAVIIILLMIFGQEGAPFIVTIFVVFPLMYEGIYQSISHIDGSIKDEVKTLSNLNSKIMREIYIPLAFPYILSTWIQSFGLGLKVMVMAEVISQPKDTIGGQIAFDRMYLDTTNIFAWTIILIFFVILMEYVLKMINQKIEK